MRKQELQKLHIGKDVINNNHILFISNNMTMENIHYICGESLNHISIIKQINIKDLWIKINLVQPNIVITQDAITAHELGLNPNIITKIKEHAFIYITDSLENTKRKLNEFFRMHALIKVDNNIYHRDCEFNKIQRTNNSTANHCYIEDDNGTAGQSFDGKPLKRVDKFQDLDCKTYEKQLVRKDIFYYKNIKNITHSKCIKYTTFDIETEMCNDITKPTRIISLACVDNITNEYKCWVLTDKKVENAMAFVNEKDMLNDFFNHIKDSDALLGWYSNAFDVPYLTNRAQIIGVDVNKYFKNFYININENKEVAHLRCDNMFFIDALSAYKQFVYYNKPKSFSLDNVAEFVLGENKIKVDNIIELYNNNINELIKYNLKDVELTYRIIQSAGIIDYALRLQQICPQDLCNFQFNSKTIENMLHHRYWHKNVFFPTKISHEVSPYKGAIVFDPVEGIHKNVVVFDFSAMYTSIYITFNYSPDTISDNGNLIVDTDLGTFKFITKDKKLGILPSLEMEMLQKRKEFQQQRDLHPAGSIEYKLADEVQGTFKTILNSIYGVVGYKRFILYDVRIPASITATARKMIDFVKEKAEQHNHKVLYGDTDSVFISMNADGFENTLKEAKSFENILNKSFPEFVSRFTDNQHTINTQSLKIEMEKIYDKLLLTNVKKRYFGTLQYYKGKILDKQKLSVTGFETRRDDTPSYFKKCLEDIYELLLENDYNKISKKCDDIKLNLYSQNAEDLVIRIKMSRNPKDYTSMPIHIRALQNSKSTVNKGETVNMLYVKGLGVVHYDGTREYDIDYDMYLEKFLYNKIKLINYIIYNLIRNQQNTLTAWLK